MESKVSSPPSCSSFFWIKYQLVWFCGVAIFYVFSRTSFCHLFPQWCLYWFPFSIYSFARFQFSCFLSIYRVKRPKVDFGLPEKCFRAKICAQVRFVIGFGFSFSLHARIHQFANIICCIVELSSVLLIFCVGVKISVTDEEASQERSGNVGKFYFKREESHSHVS